MFRKSTLSLFILSAILFLNGYLAAPTRAASSKTTGTQTVIQITQTKHSTRTTQGTTNTIIPNEETNQCISNLWYLNVRTTNSIEYISHSYNGCGTTLHYGRVGKTYIASCGGLTETPAPTYSYITTWNDNIVLDVDDVETVRCEVCVNGVPRYFPPINLEATLNSQGNAVYPTYTATGNQLIDTTTLPNSQYMAFPCP